MKYILTIKEKPLKVKNENFDYWSKYFLVPFMNANDTIVEIDNKIIDTINTNRQAFNFIAKNIYNYCDTHEISSIKFEDGYYKIEENHFPDRRLELFESTIIDDELYDYFKSCFEIGIKRVEKETV